MVTAVRCRILTSPSAWDEFHEQAKALGARFVWRGQESDWPLLASVDRPPRPTGYASRDDLLKWCLEECRKFALSRPSFPAATADPDELLALGQHYGGKKTPLLDWTLNPDIAAFFALQPAGAAPDGFRYVYALGRTLHRLLWKSKRAGRVVARERAAPFVVVVPTHIDRLRLQQGLFTKALNGNDIKTNVETWARKRPDDLVFETFKIPTADRDTWLRLLDEIGINRAALGLDLP
jgi:hypothetical protein